ncbi:MAG: CoA-binding protein [Desulfobacterales bacterium]|nr:MAG: CoA-binding protein [Desulfobacterales bacterium]
MKLEEQRKLDRIFNPRGMALFGGIGNPGSFGYLIALSQIRYGYSGNLYPISLKGGEIAGRRIYKNLDQVEGPVDLASISVPAKAVPAILRDCLKHGVAGAQVHSSGFAEVGDREGIALQKELTQIAQKGLRIIGPNCFGIHCPRGRITLLPGSDFSQDPGSVAFISQSGGVATDFGYEARSAGIGLSKVISFGNGCDLDAIQLLDYLADDPETECIGAYIEGVKDGCRFLKTVRRVSDTKPVIIWKAGLTPLGGQAALSHTGSMAGEAKIWSAALAQAGAIAVQGLDEIIDTLMAIKYLKNPGRRIALIGGGGAIGVFSCDLAHRWDLQLPRFSPETQRRLRKHFPTPGNSMANPLDTGSPVIPVEIIKNSIQEVLTSEPVDIIIMILLLRSLEVEVQAFMDMIGLQPPTRGIYLKEMLDVLTDLKNKTGKDIVAVFENRARLIKDVAVEKVSREMRSAYHARGIPVFPSAERALRGIQYVQK